MYDKLVTSCMGAKAEGAWPETKGAGKWALAVTPTGEATIEFLSLAA